MVHHPVRHIHIHILTHIHRHIHILTHIHIYIHTYTHTYIHTAHVSMVLNDIKGAAGAKFLIMLLAIDKLHEFSYYSYRNKDHAQHHAAVKASSVVAYMFLHVAVPAFVHIEIIGTVLCSSIPPLISLLHLLSTSPLYLYTSPLYLPLYPRIWSIIVAIIVYVHKSLHLPRSTSLLLIPFSPTPHPPHLPPISADR